MNNIKPMLLVLLLLCSPLSASDDSPKVSALSLEAPIWASGWNDAKWLLATKKDNPKKIGFFNLSANKSNLSKEPIVEKEDDIGRTSRSLPLYLAERINVETECAATNYILVVQGSGPILSSHKWNFSDFKAMALKNDLSIIVFGHYQQDHLRLSSTIEIEAWDVKQEKQIFSIVENKLFSDPSGVAAHIPRLFEEKLQQQGLCSYEISSLYPKPNATILPQYLDGLGQLLAQTLADNGIIPGDSIWGEVQMIEWYRRLWRQMPESSANKLMFAKGLITSQRYGGSAHTEYSVGFRDFLQSHFSINDTLSKLSPLFYSEFGFASECRSVKKRLSSIPGQYKSWLNTIDCSDAKH